MSAILNLKSGNLIRVKDVKRQYFVDLLIEIRGENIYSFANLESPYRRLSVTQHGSVTYKETNDKSCLFNIEHVPQDSNIEAIYYVKACYAKIYLCFDVDGVMVGYVSNTVQISTIDLNENSINLSIKKIHDNPFNATCQLNHKTSAYLDNDISLNSTCPLRSWEIHRFIHEGYVQLSNLISCDKIETCCKFLNSAIGKPGSIIPGGTQNGLGKFEGGIASHVSIRNLLTTELVNVLSYILGGPDAADMNNLHTRIAFRFPEFESGASTYIDNTSWHTDGFRQGKSHPFSLLVGICLSDVVEEYSGNLIVWPSSHLLIHPCKKGILGDIDRGKLQLCIDKLSCCVCQLRVENVRENIPCCCQSPLFSHSSASKDINDVRKTEVVKDISAISTNIGNYSSSEMDSLSSQDMTLPSLSDSYQVKAKKGDVVILHPDLAHTGGPNLSADIRKMIYFRVRHNKTNLKRLEKSLKLNSNSESNVHLPSINISNYQTLAEHHLLNMWIDLPGIMSHISCL